MKKMTFCEALEALLTDPVVEGIRYKHWRRYIYIYKDPAPPYMLRMHYPASVAFRGHNLAVTMKELQGEWTFFDKQKTDMEVEKEMNEK